MHPFWCDVHGPVCTPSQLAAPDYILACIAVLCKPTRLVLCINQGNHVNIRHADVYAELVSTFLELHAPARSMLAEQYTANRQ